MTPRLHLAPPLLRWTCLVVLAALLPATMPAPAAAAVDVDALWDFRDPAASEARFRAALQTARGDDALVLQTQIARTWGSRRDFAKARELLQAIAPAVETAGFEARTRYQLELGRTYASATHAPESQTADSREAARRAFQAAADAARAGGGLDGLRIDALHMMTFVDTAPAEQLRWAEAGLAAVEASSQAGAKAWEASLRNNAGVALNELGRHAEALVQFQRALALREAAGRAVPARIARWMIANTLRRMGRLDEALAMQLKLEADWQAAGDRDEFVFEELEQIYRAKGDEARARHYAALRQAPK